MIRPTILSLACIALIPLAQAADHQIDPTFGSSAPGWSRLYQPAGGTQNEKAVAFARTADGGYVVALEVAGGIANNSTGKRIGLTRLDRDGDYVTSGFGVNGRVFKDAFLTSVTDMTIDAQGRIIVVGATPGPGGLSDFGVVRFNPNGSDDTSFAGDGGTSFGYDNIPFNINIDDRPTSVLADPDGRIVVAGNYLLGSSQQWSVVRFNIDGSVDSTFGSVDNGTGGLEGSHDGFVSGANAYARRILRIDSGYYVIAGTSVVSSLDTDFAARILTPHGSPWADFMGSAEFSFNEPAAGGSLFDILNDAILVDPTTILLVGNASDRCAATRIKATTDTLEWDPSFVGSALAGRPNRYIGATSASACESAALRSDGRMLLVGRTPSVTASELTLDMAVEPAGNSASFVGMATRLNADGSPDNAFGVNGSYTYIAPTTGDTPSYYTGFKQVRFDGTQAVILGSAVDSNSSVDDFDGVITRLQSDVIFANGFDAQP